MSFVAKAVKKVFSGIKKLVKTKVFKWIAIAALVFFTAGVAAGGFAAFTGVNGIASFFTAVGQTMATGAASIASSLGFQGMSASLASHGGAAAIQAGLTTSATSATGAALTANAATGSISAVGGSNTAATAGGVLTTRAEVPLALSAKGTAAATAAANVSAAEQALGMSIAPGTDLYATAAANGAATGANLEVINSALLTQAPAGMSATNKMIALSAISSGATAVLNHTAANNKRKPKTFIAGALSRGSDPEDFSKGYSVSFDRSGGSSLASQRNVPAPANTDTSVTPPAEAQPSVARNLSQGIGGDQPLFSQNNATYDAEEKPGEYDIQSILKAPAEAREGLAIAAAASQPEYQNHNSFFANFEATQLGGGKRGSDFESRIFGGSILGVA